MSLSFPLSHSLSSPCVARPPHRRLLVCVAELERNSLGHGVEFLRPQGFGALFPRPGPGPPEKARNYLYNLPSPSSLLCPFCRVHPVTVCFALISTFIYHVSARSVRRCLAVAETISSYNIITHPAACACQPLCLLGSLLTRSVQLLNRSRRSSTKGTKAPRLN